MGDPEARMTVTLKELARKTRDGSTTLTQAVDACIGARLVSGIDCDRATFLQRCAVAGIPPTLGPRLSQELSVRVGAAPVAPKAKITIVRRLRA